MNNCRDMNNVLECDTRRKIIKFTHAQSEEEPRCHPLELDDRTSTKGLTRESEANAG